MSNAELKAERLAELLAAIYNDLSCMVDAADRRELHVVNMGTRLRLEAARIALSAGGAA